MKRFIFVFALFLSLASCGKSLQEKQADIGKEVFFNHDYDKAQQLAYEYFGKSTSDYIAYSTMIQQEQEKEYLAKNVEIVDGWKWYIDGNYIYVKGRVKNNGDKIIRYFEVNADFLNSSNNVVDTNYTNSGQEFNPGNMKSFEIMQPASSDIKFVSLSVKKILFK